MVSQTADMPVLFYISSSRNSSKSRFKNHVLVPHRIRENKTVFCRILLLEREGKYLTPYDRAHFYTYIMLKCLKWQSHLFCPQAMSKEIF